MEGQLQNNHDGSPTQSAVTANGLTILIPDINGPTEPNEASSSEHGAPAQDDDHDAPYMVGDSSAGLRLESVLEPRVTSSVSDDTDEDTEPGIDVVQIVGAIPSQLSMLRLSTLESMLNGRSEKRELSLHPDTGSLLNDDVEFTRRYVDAEARRLLSGLKHFQHSGEEPSRRAIIFVAYDVGAIVLQKAISIAAMEDLGEPGVFTDTARVIFCGCFQRSHNQEEMETKIFRFLDVNGDLENWQQYVTLGAAKNLALVAKEARVSFLRSKIALRSRVISLYAGCTRGKIPEAFDFFTATLGIPTELPIQEVYEEMSGSTFPLLSANLCTSVECWAPDRWQAALETTLMSMIPNSAQMISRSQARDHPILHSEAYQAWSSSSGTQILYIDGPDPHSNIEAVEQIGLDWIRKPSPGDRNIFSFTFDAGDPLRSSISPLLTAALLQYYVNVERITKLFKDQHKLQNEWLEQDILNLVSITSALTDESMPVLLFGLDQCNTRSRKILWDLLGNMANRTEEAARFVVTSTKPIEEGWSSVLRGELKTWPNIMFLEYTMEQNKGLDCAERGAMHELSAQKAWISRLSPKADGMTKFDLHDSFERLQRIIDDNTRREILALLETYSRWPTVPSSANLDLFCSLLENISPSSTTRSVLNTFLQLIPDQAWLRWLLSWISHARHPLASWELSMLMCYCTQKSEDSFNRLSSEEIQHSLDEINHRLRGLLDVQEDNVHISSFMLEILESGTIKETGPEMTTDFLLAYLRSTRIQESLSDMYQRYEDKVERSSEKLTPPLMPDAPDVIFYAVQALPYHLSGTTISDETREAMCNPDGPYKAWARAYWAMSNPISRSAEGPPPSAWAAWESSPEFGPYNLVRTRLDNQQGLVDRDEAAGKPMSKLVAAVKANNEDLAMIFAEEVLNEFEADRNRDSINGPVNAPWPVSILWRAAWLGMNQLLEFLIDHGMPVDDQSSMYSPSPLNLATQLGYSDTATLLVRKGADLRVKTFRKRTSLYGAASRGYLEIVRTLLEKEPSMLEELQPSRPLYMAAAWGNWKVVKLLIDLGGNPNMNPTAPEAVDPDDPEGTWTPLTAALSCAFDKTTRVLLEHGADPDKPASWGHRMPLNFAAVRHGSAELVRLLLENKADPNHKLIDPPILTAIICGTQFSDDIKSTIFKLLLDNDPPVRVDKPDGEGQTALIAAARREDIGAMRWLLEHGADINAVDSRNQHALFWAVIEQKPSAAKELLNHREKPLLEQTNTWGESLLQMSLDRPDLFQMLLDAGADVTYENSQQQAILNYAVTKCDVNAVKLLLSLAREKNVNIHHPDSQGWTPILDATGFRPHAEIVRLLMEHGARLSDTTPNGSSPFHLAAQEIRPDILRILLEYGMPEDLVKRDNDGNTPLLKIREFKPAETLNCMQLLVRAGFDVNDRNNLGLTILMMAAEWGPVAEEVHNYLLSRPSIDAKLASNVGITALHAACHSGSVVLVNKLLQLGADVHARAFTLGSIPLIAACRPYLDDSNNAYEKTDTLETMERIVRDLTAHGADVNAMRGTSLYTPLCAASLWGGVETINFLLDKSASVRKEDPLGRLPIHFAAANGIRNFETLALLHDGEIMVSDRFNKNVLHWAAEFGHVNTVRAIFDRLSPKEQKEYANFPDADGWTPLVWACRPTYAEAGAYWVLSEEPDFAATIQCLLDHGADKSVKFRLGSDEEALEEFTPLKMARRCGFDEELLSLLEPESSETTEGTAVEQKYRQTRASCDFCLAQIWGVLWTCLSCDDGDYVLCKKCYQRGHVEHQRTVDDHREGEDHRFEMRTYNKQEFEYFPSVAPSEQAPSVAGGDDRPESRQDDAGDDHEDAATPGMEDWGLEGDEIGDLEFPDLNDLKVGSLDE